MENQDELIENFKQSIADVWIKDSQSTWPIDFNSVAHLFLDIFVKELLEDIEQFKSRGFDDAEIASRLKIPGRIIRLVMPCVLGMKACRMSVETIRNRVNYLLSLTKHLKHGNLSNLGGKNIVLSSDAVLSALGNRKMVTAHKEDSLCIHKLCAILWNYAECLFFRTHGFIREFHGPYYFPGRKEEILIRDFICLKPVGLWEAASAISYESIRVIAAYRNLGMSIDIYNNVSIRESTTYVNSLDSYYLETDGKKLELEEVERICRDLSGVILSVTREIETLDWHRLAKKYAEIFWYVKKGLKNGHDWRPPGIINERINNGDLNTRLQNLSPQALQRMLRISF